MKIIGLLTLVLGISPSYAITPMAGHIPQQAPLYSVAASQHLEIEEARHLPPALANHFQSSLVEIFSLVVQHSHLSALPEPLIANSALLEVRSVTTGDIFAVLWVKIPAEEKVPAEKELFWLAQHKDLDRFPVVQPKTHSSLQLNGRRPNWDLVNQAFIDEQGEIFQMADGWLKVKNTQMGLAFNFTAYSAGEQERYAQISDELLRWTRSLQVSERFVGINELANDVYAQINEWASEADDDDCDDLLHGI